ncbi:MAG: hypothetical protein AB8B97_22225 [Granulosicoccus sp.]
MKQARNIQNHSCLKQARPVVNGGINRTAPGKILKKNVRYAVCAGLAWLALTLWSTASALEFQCNNSGDIRYLRVDIPGQEYLCEVSVTYLDSGVRDVKWYARNDTLFCSTRAYELRDKYTDLWNYSCNTWPDRDGIDKLSTSQRLILDQRLKALIEEGEQSNPPYRLTAVKAVASTLVDEESGKIAFQFFTDSTNFTEIIDDNGSEWSVATKIDDLATHVVSEMPVTSAIIHSISVEGTLEVHTRLVDQLELECFGTQHLTPTGRNGMMKERTPHRYVCNTSDTSVQSLSEATSLESETQTQ